MLEVKRMSTQWLQPVLYGIKLDDENDSYVHDPYSVKLYCMCCVLLVLYQSTPLLLGSYDIDLIDLMTAANR